MASEHPRYLFGYDFMKRLQDAGLIGKGIQRVVIDCKHDDYAVMYVQQAIDSRVLDALLDTSGLLKVVIAEHGNDGREGLQVKNEGGVVGGPVNVVVGETGPEQYKRTGR